MKQDSKMRAALERTRVTSQWPAAAVDELCAHIQVRKYRDGDRVMSLGDKVDAVWIVTEGVLLLTRIWKNGRRFLYGHMIPGQLTGINPVFDGEPAVFDVVARGDATTLVVPGAIVRKLVDEHPAVARAIIGFLCWRTRVDYDALELKTMNSIRCQLAKFILWMSRNRPPDTTGHVGLDAHISQEDLADIIGVSRQSINREIQRFVKEGLLKQGYRMLVLLDRDRMLAVAQEEEEELSDTSRSQFQYDRRGPYKLDT